MSSTRCSHPGCTKLAGTKSGTCIEHRQPSAEVVTPGIPDQPAVTLEAEPAVVDEPEAAAPPRSRRPPRSASSAAAANSPSLDAEVVGGAIAQLMIHQEAQDRLNAATRRRERTYREDEFGLTVDEEAHANAAEKRRPYRVVPRRSRPDPTAVIDPVTEAPPASLKPGWVVRHVRTVDHQDRPSQARVAEFQDYGYEAVRDANGDAITTRFGLVMQGPPEQYALRVTEKMPLGALNRDESLELAMQMAEEANRLAENSVARVIVSDEHRTQRMQFSPGVEIIQD